ncbi:hypothetical protein [Humidesulfovibrio idahonensis]
MEALATLLFFVALWGLARVLKLLAPRSPDIRKLSEALSSGEPGRERPPEGMPGPPPASPEAQSTIPTKPTP